jgi:acyl-coenzyme A thioesterase PaaI-like protein
VTEGRLRAVGRCIRSGGRALFCDAQVWDAAGELVGIGSAQLVRLPTTPGADAAEA